MERVQGGRTCRRAGRVSAHRAVLGVVLVAACASRTPPVADGRRFVAFAGMCDASGAIALSDRLIVVADDEDNVLRTYDVERGGPPLSAVDISAALGLPLKGKKRPEAPEIDLEAATRVGDRAYWMTSHGRNTKGRLRPERLLFFATTVSQTGAALAGAPYERLLEDMLEQPSLAGYGLAEAAALPPKTPGGLNIEGLTAMPGGGLLLGFRNPVPGRRALLLPLLNPSDLVNGGVNVKARFGEPILLDLDGDGVRSLTWWQGRYLIVAGSATSGGRSRLFEWSGEGAPVPLSIDLAGFNAEGFFTPEERSDIMLLSDDGDRSHAGKPCKKLRDPAQKSFRGLWVTPPSRPSRPGSSGSAAGGMRGQAQLVGRPRYVMSHVIAGRMTPVGDISPEYCRQVDPEI